MFNIGEVVRVYDPKFYGPMWAGPMLVIGMTNSHCIVRHPVMGSGGFLVSELVREDGPW